MTLLKSSLRGRRAHLLRRRHSDPCRYSPATAVRAVAHVALQLGFSPWKCGIVSKCKEAARRPATSSASPPRASPAPSGMPPAQRNAGMAEQAADGSGRARGPASPASLHSRCTRQPPRAPGSPSFAALPPHSHSESYAYLGGVSGRAFVGLGLYLRAPDVGRS